MVQGSSCSGVVAGDDGRGDGRRARVIRDWRLMNFDAPDAPRSLLRAPISDLCNPLHSLPPPFPFVSVEQAEPDS